jgi:FAD/FMN-containing dehydrogenase/Fe-S oxidoreductase
MIRGPGIAMLDFIDQKRAALSEHLRQHVDGEVRFEAAACKLYSTDASIYQIEPLGVVLPRTTDGLVAAVQIALEMHVPIVPRGGGTSLSGQSIGRGLVIDCSKYLHRILEIDSTNRTARVQPGVVLDQLNAALAGHGLMFGPDVATASRANLGGMIGNNSAGSHSIVHGKTIDHVRRLDVVLSDGSRAQLGPIAATAWRQQEDRSLLGSIYRGVRTVVEAAAPEITRHFPRILRRVSGYNLDVIAYGLLGGSWESPVGSWPDGVRRGEAPMPDAQIPTPSGLHHLVIGGEGTLAVVTEAELRLVPRPKAAGLLVPQFDSLGAAMDALAVCLEAGPSAVELLDHLLLDLAHDNLSLRHAAAPLSSRSAALFMVEFSGDERAGVEDRIERLNRRLQGMPGLVATLSAVEPALRDPLWGLRNAAVPLLLGLPGDEKPVTFIEDTAVAPERLPAFVQRFRDILSHHGTHGAFYGHASVGCLHIRPVLNLKRGADVARMRRITEDITDLVLEFGGSLSGEHGDGLARSEWNRKMFGETVYNAFCQVKHAFDPHNLFNPGKVVHAPAMTEHLRYACTGVEDTAPATWFDYSKQEGFVRAVELCNGSGVCRKMQGGTMCPSFRATRDEKDSTRGRANVLRLALSGEQPIKALREDWVREVLELCLMCKACKAECPSNVDLAKLKAEWLSLYYRDRQRPIGQWLMANIHRVNRLGSLTPRLVNRVQAGRLFRWLLEKVAGIDRRRSLPALQEETVRAWHMRRLPRSPVAPDVLLLADCFSNFNEPHIGKAAVAVLEAAGCRVRLAGLTCCGRALISKGYLAEVRQLIQAQAPRLASQVAAGIPILGLEPSCLLTLCDEWPELVPGPATRAIARSAHLADVWLAGELDAGRRTLTLRSLAEPCLIHGHCHQKALVGMQGSASLLRRIPELEVRVLDTGCCGMAGSFGYECAHYDISAAIARQDLLPALEKEPQALVVAAGTSCRHQIKDLTPRRALHPLEVVANRLAGQQL